MKIAVLADIHGNLPALQTVVAHVDSWRPDQVVVAGDVVNRGPRPNACLRIILEKKRLAGWLVVRGNHEDYVLDQARPDAPRSGPVFDIAQNAYWTVQRLNGDVKELETMPFQVALTTPDIQEVRVVHASMFNNRDGIYPETPDEELRQKISPPPAVLCAGHTHRPLVRSIDDSLVVNVGAVGFPFDGDDRASYAQLTWRKDGWRAEIIRLPFDRAQTERDIHETGFFTGAGPLASIMLVEFHQSRPHIHRWSYHYERVVLAGEMTLEESVHAYLTKIKRP